MTPARIVGAVCSVKKCTRPTWAEGLCSQHYNLRRMTHPSGPWGPRLDALTRALTETDDYMAARRTGAPHDDALAIAIDAARTRHRDYLRSGPE